MSIPEHDRKTLQRLHDAAQIGDVDKVKEIFDTHKELDIDVTRRGRNTTLHIALLHNQEGPLIDYLIQNGADVNVENTKGYCPITLAIIHCKGKGKAVRKLITAGATWEKFDSGAFAGLSARDVAIKYEKEDVINLLDEITADGICKEVMATTIDKLKERKICPICNQVVKFPTKMSRIADDQAHIEKRVQINGEFRGGKHKHRKYIARKYMDQLLAHSDGQAYKKLCGIEYHALNNIRLRKEISESYGVLHGVQECCVRLGISSSTASDNVNLENVFLIDLCSGKGITTALCGALDGEGSNNYFLAVDRLLPHTMPHFYSNHKQIKYISRDIMTEEFFNELAEMIKHQSIEQGRTCILVGMHLCGMLSMKAIEFFERMPEVKGLVLSPCCLPTKNEQSKAGFVKLKPENGAEDIALFHYFNWANRLKERILEVHDGEKDDGASNVRLYTDNEMHTEKNAIIVSVRTQG